MYSHSYPFSDHLLSFVWKKEAFSQNIFYVPLESHTCIGTMWQKWQNFYFWGNYPFNGLYNAAILMLPVKNYAKMPTVQSLFCFQFCLS